MIDRHLSLKFISFKLYSLRPNLEDYLKFEAMFWVFSKFSSKIGELYCPITKNHRNNKIFQLIEYRNFEMRMNFK
jgi:hypothetical protein